MHPDNLVQSIQMEGINVVCGLIHTEDITFDPEAPENFSRVLIKKRAFSCNYRDKSFILKAATNLSDYQFFSIGSDFVADVIAIGAKVTSLKVGDRVIGNNAYPHSGVEGIRPGVPTNQGSTELQIFHEVKLLKIPPELPDEVAAGFSIGAQTAHSMIRKLAVKPGDNVLVTSAKSNTSLFVIGALKHRGVNLYATSTSHRFEQELLQMGVKQLIQVDPNAESWSAMPQFQEIMANTGGLDCIVDPFFDLHVGKVISLLKPGDGGRYTTCGLYDQYSDSTGNPFKYHGLPLAGLLTFAMINNVQLIGNCVGQTSDLQHGIQNYAEGKFQVIVDSVFSDKNIKEFLERTYSDRHRFGKVIFRYS